jgi:hypothetical protein
MAGVVSVAVPGVEGPYRSPGRRLITGSLVVCLAAYLLGGVAQHWVSPAAQIATPTPASELAGVSPGALAATDAARAQAERAGIDLNGVVDVVAHRVTPVPGRAGVLESVDDRYRAVFDASGFSLDDFGVSLSAVHRGDRAVPLRMQRWRGEANVASRQISPGVTERVTSREGELEWDVVLDRPLRGRGDLVVEARITGSMGDSTRGRDGLVFGTRGAAVRVGALVAKDARGRLLHRALPESKGSSLRLVVPGPALAEAAYPITLDPTVSREHPVSDPVSTPAAGSQYIPAVAFDGTNYLAVWVDGRDGAGFKVFGARVNQAGVVLDSTGIAISTANGFLPEVAFDGANYLVVWVETHTGTGADIVGIRVSRAGVVLDGSGIAISTAVGHQDVPEVGFDGTNVLVVWQDRRSGPAMDIYGARVSRSGKVLDSSGIPISTATNHQSGPAVSFDGTNFLVVWQHRLSGPASDVYGTRVSRAGAVLDGTGIAISTAAKDQSQPAVAFDGTNFLVVWQDQRSGSASDVYGTRVSRAGVVLNGPGIPISTAAGDQGSVAVGFDGTNFLVVWQVRSGGDSDADVYGARVTRAGVVLDEPGIAISVTANEEEGPAVAFDGTNYLVVWADRPTDPFDDNILGARLNRGGVVLDRSGFAIAVIADDQSSPAVAFDGTNYLVVWTENRRSGTGLDIYGARVRPGGAFLDGSGIRISSAVGDQHSPAVAFDGSNFLVVWSHRSPANLGIGGARVKADGVVLDPVGITVANPGFDSAFLRPEVAFNGVGYLVVWTAEDVESGLGDIYGTRVTRAGRVVDDAGIPIAVLDNNQGEPAVDSDGTNFLVVWSDGRTAPGYDIFGARVSWAGAVLDSDGIPVSTAADHQVSPTVGFDGMNYLVAWADRRSGTTSDIYATRVGRTGRVRNPSGLVISAANGDQDSPQVAINGSFLVVWRDRRSGTNWDIFGNRVTGVGSVLDGDGFAIARSPIDELAPAVTADPGAAGRFAIGYQRFVPEAPYGSNRVFLRTSPK